MQEVRSAFRSLFANPIVSFVAILSLALGIGANTAIFSILDSLLLRSLPVHDPAGLTIITEENRSRGSWTNPIWEQVRDRSDLFGGALAWSASRLNLSLGGQTEFVNGVWASGSYFDVLGVPPLLGRTFVPSDDERGGGPEGPVTVISDSFWKRHFDGGADIIGQPLTLEGVTYTIVGVTPTEFTGLDVGRKMDVVIPIGTEPLHRGEESWLDRRSTWWLRMMVRLAPGQSNAAAVSALRGVQPQIREATIPDHWRPEHQKTYLTKPLDLYPAATGSSSLRNRYQQPLFAISIVVALVLLIACANIANLQLARATARRQELSVRLALGASRLRLTRQLLTESLVLSGLGALLGLLFAIWGSRLLVAQLSTHRTTVFLDLSPDWRVLGFTATVAILTALLFGTAPALRAARVQPGEALAEQGRTMSGRRGLILRNALVVTQIVLSLVLVAGAGLFVQTFNRLADLDFGFDRDAVLVVAMSAQRSDTPPEQRAALYERARQAVLGIPGVADAASSMVTPVSGSIWNNTIEVEGLEDRSEKERTTNINFLSPDWFATYGTAILAGRDIDERDQIGTPQVAVVNETFAARFFDGGSPLGKIVRHTWEPNSPVEPIEIVGLVEDAIYQDPREEIPPTMYLALNQFKKAPSSSNLSLRPESGPPSQLIRSVASTLQEVDKDLALTFRTLKAQVDSRLVQERLMAILSAFFGGLALLLAGLGLYGVMSYGVTQRRLELGIRMALGSAPGGVVKIVLGRVGLLIGLGVLVGTLGALWLARFAESLLFGLEPNDPGTFIGAAAVLTVVGLASGWLPARRASRIDPARVLRE